ncbi:MAG: frsA [Gammaproteobacteria bacterium]|jgi:dienelactone hydrolase|nr:frsA [Gammaproteobacteria bacterium]
MQTQKIEYLDGDQKLLGEIIYPQELKGNHPAVIVFPAFEGIAEFALDYGKKLAEKGYIAFVADMYGDRQTADTLEGCFALITPFLQSRELVRRRALLAFETLKNQKNVNCKKIGAIGFCFGGMCVLELARSGADLCAGVSCHGVLVKSDLKTHDVKSKLLILAGYADPQVPAAQSLQDFAAEMQNANNHDWIFTFFGDAKHSYTDKKTGSFDLAKEQAMGREYNQRAAEFTFRYALDFFDKELT